MGRGAQFVIELPVTVSKKSLCTARENCVHIYTAKQGKTRKGICKQHKLTWKSAAL